MSLWQFLLRETEGSFAITIPPLHPDRDGAGVTSS